MTEAARINVPEWSVSELSAALKRTVEDAYGYVRVRGEISNYRGPASSGHCYFALKDEGARIDAVIWRGTFGRIKFKPEEGLEVIATGRLTTYPGRSSYQIVIDSLEPAGVGALMALLEERHPGADARRLQALDDDLVGGLAREGGDLARGDHLQPLLRALAQAVEGAAPDHRVDARGAVLEGEVGVA